MTKYIMMALFYAGSVLIAYCLGYRAAEKWESGAPNIITKVPMYRNPPPMPPVKPPRKEPNPNYIPPASVKKAERDEYARAKWICPGCGSLNHVRLIPCWLCGAEYIPDTYPDDEEAVE